MSKLYNQYVKLKVNNPKMFYLFKCGVFFIFIDEDAKTMSKILNLKLCNLNSEIVKCGFPETSLDKYLYILNSLNLKVEIISSSTELSKSNPQNYLSNVKIENIIKRILKLNIYDLSISQTYDFLIEIQKELSEIIGNNVEV